MKLLFTPGKIGNMEIQNRFVRSATGESLAAADGQVTDALVSLYTELAKGGVGLIVTGVAFVHESGRSGYKMPGLHKDEMIPGWQRLIKQAHNYGAKIVPQIVAARCKPIVPKIFHPLHRHLSLIKGPGLPPER